MKLFQPIALNQIATFRGIADFYYWKTIPVARRWPRPPVQPNSDAQLKSRQLFRSMHALLKALPTSWHLAWRRVRLPQGRSVEDLKRKHLVWTLARNFWVEPPNIRSAATLTTQATETDTVCLECAPYVDAEAPAKTAWLYRPSLDTPFLCEYKTLTLARTRHLALYSNVLIDGVGLTKPIAQKWKATNHEWTLTLPKNATPCIVIPYHKDALT